MFAVKLPELSAAMADERLAALSAAGADTLVLTDASCLLQLEGRARKRRLRFRALHLAEILAAGAGAGGGPRRAGTAGGSR